MSSTRLVGLTSQLALYGRARTALLWLLTLEATELVEQTVGLWSAVEKK